MINRDELSLHDLLVHTKKHPTGKVTITGRESAKGKDLFCLRLSPEDLDTLIKFNGVGALQKTPWPVTMAYGFTFGFIAAMIVATIIVIWG